MDNPRLAFFFDEIPFWRLVAILTLVSLLVFFAVAVFSSQANTVLGGWYNIPRDVHVNVSTDYQYHIQPPLPPLKLNLVQEIQNLP